MGTTLWMPDASGHYAVFEGADGRGTLSCREVLPLTIAWHLTGARLGDIVRINNPAGTWLEGATIVSADAGPSGTVFQLSF